MLHLMLHCLALSLHRSSTDYEPVRFWTWLILNLSDSEPIWFRTCLNLDLFELEPVCIWIYLNLNPSDSEPTLFQTWFQKCLILILSDSEPIWYWTYNIRCPIWGLFGTDLLRFPGVPFLQSWDHRQPLLAHPVVKFARKWVNPSSLSPSTLQ